MKQIHTECLKVGEDVIIIDTAHPMYNELGEIHSMSGFTGNLRISVIFYGGEVYRCSHEQLGLA